MEKIINYIKDSYAELVEKVTWPSRKELQQTSVLVIVASAIFALLIWAMDFGFLTASQAIY